MGTFLDADGDFPNGFLLCQADLRLGEREETLLLVNLHPDHASEDTRLVQFQEWERKVKVWAGDFNTLTREDYSQQGWEEIGAVRRRGKWEQPRTEFSNYLHKKGLTDSWASVGRPSPVSTCRFSTHIDYIFKPRLPVRVVLYWGDSHYTHCF